MVEELRAGYDACMNDDVTNILIWAYGATGVASMYGYVPQLLAFYRNPRLCMETPLTSWLLWGTQTTTFFLYALLVNGDPIFVLNTMGFMIVTNSCLAMQLWGRHKARKFGLEGRRHAPPISADKKVE